MTRAKALEAVDAALADGVKKLFGVLVSNVLAGEDPEGCARRFGAGLAFHRDARAKAAAEIEKTFPE